MMPFRVIPVLLWSRGGLVKTVRFANPTYVGDPINAIRILNEKEVDELVLLDIDASREKRGPNHALVAKVASECFMPLCYGGGIRSYDDAAALFAVGVEKILVNTLAFTNPRAVEEIAKRFGAQSIVVGIDVKKRLFGQQVYVTAGTDRTGAAPVEYARRVVACGAGELLVNSIDRDGTMSGYDLELLQSVSQAVNVPVVACGGAGSLQHFAEAVRAGGASAVAAGSMFVFYGKHRAVLINYPEAKDVRVVWQKA